MRKAIKLLRLLERASYRRALTYGVAAAIEHEPFLRGHKFATVIDAGANKGQFALAVRAHMPHARILAFEPLQSPAAIFRRMFQSDEIVRLFETALGSSTGTATIHLSNHLDSSSLLPIGKEQVEVFPHTEEVGTLSIAVTALDDIADSLGLRGPTLLKIDVQGFELSLLRGAERSLAQFIDDIYVELSYRVLYEGQPLAHEVIDWLRLHGFVLGGVYNTAFATDGAVVQSDMHFRRLP